MKDLLSQERFREILEQACDRVFKEKGAERHGHGDDFSEQPWVAITRNVGVGFVLGQAMKKLMELRSFEDSSPDAWRRECLDAIVYITMAVQWTDYDNELQRQQEEVRERD